MYTKNCVVTVFGVLSSGEYTKSGDVTSLRVAYPLAPRLDARLVEELYGSDDHGQTQPTDQNVENTGDVAQG